VALEFAIGATYEAVRRRSFPELLDRLEHVRAISRFDASTSSSTSARCPTSMTSHEAEAPEPLAHERRMRGRRATR